MKALIVEDEAIAARALQRLLAAQACDVDVVAVLGSVREAVAWFAANPMPDLVFLDVQLADGLSFEILETVAVRAPVVFTTAYDQYALRAFEAHGAGYLLKPIDPERLAPVLARCRQLLAAGSATPGRAIAGDYRAAAQAWRSRFLVAQGDALVPVPVAEVAYFVKELVVRLVTRDGRGYALSQSLDELAPQLDPARFFRLNRQLLVQIEAVRRVERGFKGRLEVRLEPPPAVEAAVSQERAAAFRAWLER